MLRKGQDQFTRDHYNLNELVRLIEEAKAEAANMSLSWNKITDKPTFITTFSGLSDTPVSINKPFHVPVVNSAGTALEFSQLLTYEPVSRTINFNNTMTTAQIQAEIDKVGVYIPRNVTITFQFANGTYTQTAPLYFIGFYGGGNIIVQGNISDNTLSITKSVFHNFSGQSCNGFVFDGVKVRSLVIRYMKIEIDTTSAQHGILFDLCKTYFMAHYNYILGSGTTYGNGIYFYRGDKGEVGSNYLSNLNVGIHSYRCSEIYCSTNDDTGTMPLYGMVSTSSQIYRYSTYPNGSTANWEERRGGKVNPP